MCKTCTDSFFSRFFFFSRLSSACKHKHRTLNKFTECFRSCFVCCSNLSSLTSCRLFFLTFLCESIATMFTFNSTFLHALYDFSTTKNVCKGFWFFSLSYFYIFLLRMIFLQRSWIFIEREYVKQLNKQQVCIRNYE